MESGSYESYEITLENNCTSSDGADYAIDDLRAFICKPNIKATQTQPVCNGEAYSHVQLSADFDLLLKAFSDLTESTSTNVSGSNEVEAQELFYTILDKEKFNEVYDPNKNNITAAVEAALVKGIYGAEDDAEEYGSLKFSAYYNDNPTRDATNLQGDFAKLARRDDSSGQRMLYFPDYIKADDSALKPNREYWFIIAEDSYSVEAESLDPLGPCTNVSEFSVAYGQTVKIDGQPTATSHGLNICSNQRPKIEVNMSGVTASGQLDTTHKFEYFDWYVGSQEEFETIKYNSVGLYESLMAFRDKSYTGTETTLNTIGTDTKFTDGMKACLLHFIDAKKLSLYKTVEFPSTYDQFDEDPNGTSIALTIIPVDPYHNKDILFCLNPFDIEIPISTREPSMKNGDDSGIIDYKTMDDVPLRIGLTQLKKCCTCAQ